jgi:uncharacterized protein YbbK (DUF523 family)
MKMISACLLGLRCAWGGDDRYSNNRAAELTKLETLIPVCLEQMGGLPTPRVPQEIQGSTGDDVLDNKCRVINENGQDVTREFINGAEEAVTEANLKATYGLDDIKIYSVKDQKNGNAIKFCVP